MAIPPSQVPPPIPPPIPPPMQVVGGKAEPGARFVAVLIDAIPAVIISVIFGLIPFIGGIIGGLLAAGWWLVRDGLDLEFADKRSPGKKIMKLRPIRLDGQPMTMEISIKRNIPLVVYCVGFVFWVVPVLGHLISVPFFIIGGLVSLIELVLALTDQEGRRWGDKLAGTKVIQVAD